MNLGCVLPAPPALAFPHWLNPTSIKAPALGPQLPSELIAVSETKQQQRRPRLLELGALAQVGPTHPLS